MGSQTNLPAMVRAYTGPTLQRSTGTRSAPQAIDGVPAEEKGGPIATGTPSLPPPPTIATVPHETIFQKTMKGFTDAE
jgi:hypothetical protein